jgi:hypothetical protein
MQGLPQIVRIERRASFFYGHLSNVVLSHISPQSFELKREVSFNLKCPGEWCGGMGIGGQISDFRIDQCRANSGSQLPDQMSADNSSIGFV